MKALIRSLYLDYLQRAEDLCYWFHRRNIFFLLFFFVLGGDIATVHRTTMIIQGQIGFINIVGVMWSGVFFYFCTRAILEDTIRDGTWFID